MPSEWLIISFKWRDLFIINIKSDLLVYDSFLFSKIKLIYQKHFAFEDTEKVNIRPINGETSI